MIIAEYLKIREQKSRRDDITEEAMLYLGEPHYVSKFLSKQDYNELVMFAHNMSQHKYNLFCNGHRNLGNKSNTTKGLIEREIIGKAGEIITYNMLSESMPMDKPDLTVYPDQPTEKADIKIHSGENLHVKTCTPNYTEQWTISIKDMKSTNATDLMALVDLIGKIHVCQFKDIKNFRACKFINKFAFDLVNIKNIITFNIPESNKY